MRRIGYRRCCIKLGVKGYLPAPNALTMLMLVASLLFIFQAHLSPVYLIEGPSICETALPDFVDNLFRMGLVFASRSSHHREHSAPSHTLLMLLRDSPLASREEFSTPSALAAERRSPNFCTSCMPKVILPFYLES